MPVALALSSLATTPKLTCFFFNWSTASSRVRFSFNLWMGRMTPEFLRLLLGVNLKTSRFFNLMKPTILDLNLEQTGTLEQLYFCRLRRKSWSTTESSFTMKMLSSEIMQFLIFFSRRSIVFCRILISSGRYPYSLLSCRQRMERRFSGVSTILSSWWPSQLSSTQVIGRTKTQRRSCRKRMKGEKQYPMLTLCCPVQQACGRTSPKTTTATVEMMIARQLGTILSRKMGSASSESEFESSSVESSRWWLFRMSRMGRATLRSYSLSEFTQICISVLLIDMNPTVSPEHTPAKQLSPKETSAQMQNSGEEDGTRGSSALDWKVQDTRITARVALRLSMSQGQLYPSGTTRQPLSLFQDKSRKYQYHRRLLHWHSIGTLIHQQRQAAKRGIIKQIGLALWRIRLILSIN